MNDQERRLDLFALFVGGIIFATAIGTAVWYFVL